jgi:hypothetical protein
MNRCVRGQLLQVVNNIGICIHAANMLQYCVYRVSTYGILYLHLAHMLKCMCLWRACMGSHYDVLADSISCHAYGV